MPLLSSAKKVLRSSKLKKSFNDKRKREMRAAIKMARALVAEKKFDEARALLPRVYKAIDKAAKRGVIKKNAAARKKSRLTVAINITSKK